MGLLCYAASLYRTVQLKSCFCMGLLRYAVFVGVAAFLISCGMDTLHSNHPIHFGGEVDSSYEAVRKVFEQNFIDGLEPEGASFAVYVKGQKVVDLWGGYADIQAARTWKEDTISVVFSTTKAVAAFCIALLADRGRLRYDDLVSKHWPGFAKNGKGNITVEWVMSHMSGLHYFNEPITKKIATEHNLMRELIENEAPKLPPGTNFSYHALTYGWLVDQIVRHTDKKKRGIGQFLREEITEPNGIDFHIGLNLSEEYRVARIAPIKTLERLKEIFRKFRSAFMFLKYSFADKKSSVNKAVSNPSWITVSPHCCTTNDPEQHAIEQAAWLGVGNARSLAKLFDLFFNKRLIGAKMLSLLKKPVVNGTNYVQKDVAFGHGFMYHPPVVSEGNPLIGHAGYGCQEVNFDTTNNIAISYISNGLKWVCVPADLVQDATKDISSNAEDWIGEIGGWQI
ncbi:unnamed protein product [Cylicocyclus nassatus]|uniref:Beta-lactamase-related domain-containing protein n=1 Tax=Cylicocyclus nassatus TaxID=53992 RepID=A0AA36H217_CYLNA|nr:unnamed protein product [Cylicocyclus nassatus]